MLTPAIVHYGAAPDVLDQRRRVLETAYAAHPERFVNAPPAPLPVPTAVWINPPQPRPTHSSHTPDDLDREEQPGHPVMPHPNNR
jgi:putative transposase